MVDTKHKWKAWIYLAPALVLLAIFTVYPIFNTVRLAFLEGYSPLENVGGDASWKVGFKNFVDVITYADFKTCLSNTMLLTVLTVPLSCFIALLIAVFLNNIPHFSKVFQTIYFLPYVTNSIAIGMVFAMMFNMIGYAPVRVDTYEGDLDDLFNRYIQTTYTAEGTFTFGQFANSCGIEKAIAKEIIKLANIAATPSTTVATSIQRQSLFNYVCAENGANDASILAISVTNSSGTFTVTPEDLERIKTYLMSSDFIKIEQVEYGYKATSMGIVNNILTAFGAKPVNWINAGSSKTANMTVMVIYIVWNALPFKILILLGGLQSVNKQYYDAAKIDGASRVTIFGRITVPLLSPMIAYVVITAFIGGFKEYTSIVGIFGEKMGAPGQKGTMNTMVGYIYDQISNDSYGVASAAALILFAIIMLVTLINLYVSKKKVHY